MGVINIIGRVYMDGADSPFDAVLREIETLREKPMLFWLIFMPRQQAKKEAMGYFLDGKVSAVFGTHTHVQTADNKILPDGTGYITDLGMTGA